jgi:hypothetical protein
VITAQDEENFSQPKNPHAQCAQNEPRGVTSECAVLKIRGNCISQCFGREESDPILDAEARARAREAALARQESYEKSAVGKAHKKAASSSPPRGGVTREAQDQLIADIRS